MAQGIQLDPQRAVLDNGVVLLWNRKADTESVAVRASFPAGASREDREHAGLASFTSRLLRRGTRRHSAQEIATRIEDRGASFGFWAGSEAAGFSAKCLGRDVGAVLEILRELTEEPLFAPDEVEKTRAEVQSYLSEVADSPRAMADLAAMEHLFPGDHPYSWPTSGTAATVASLKRNDLAAFHQSFYGAHGMTVSVSGAVEIDELRRSLGAWLPGTAGPAPERVVEPNRAATRKSIPMAHKSQVELVLAGPGIPRDHPDFFALSMVNLILGSLGMMGRLGARVREEHGMAYHVSCHSQSRRWAGEWSANAGVTPADLDRTIEAILTEVRLIREELVTEQEFADACDYLIGSLPLRMESNDGIAGYMLNAEYHGLGLDFLDRYPGLIRAESRESLREAARRHMDPECISVFTAGPVAGSEA